MTITCYYQKLLGGEGFEAVVQATETKRGKLKVVMKKEFKGLLEAKSWFKENRDIIRRQAGTLLV